MTLNSAWPLRCDRSGEHAGQVPPPHRRQPPPLAGPARPGYEHRPHPDRASPRIPHRARMGSPEAQPRRSPPVRPRTHGRGQPHARRVETARNRVIQRLARVLDEDDVKNLGKIAAKILAAFGRNDGQWTPRRRGRSPPWRACSSRVRRPPGAPRAESCRLPNLLRDGLPRRAALSCVASRRRACSRRWGNQ